MKNTAWYQQLDELSNVDARELEWPNFNRKLWIKAPSVWGVVYNVFFYWRFGRILSILFTIYALFLIMLGVGHSSGATAFGVQYFNAHITTHFSWAIFATIWPIVTIVFGEFVCRSAMSFVSYQTENLEERVVQKAEQAVGSAEAAIAVASAQPEAS